MSAQEIKALVQRHADAFSAGDEDAWISTFTSDVVYHNPAPPPGEIRGWDGMREWFAGIRRAFPDATETIDDIVVEGDMVAFRCTCRGVHRGELYGIPPTHREVVFEGIVMSRIVDRKMVEMWEHFDFVGLRRQLGAMPAIA